MGYTSIGRILGVPLKQGDQVIGVINVFDEEEGDFDEDGENSALVYHSHVFSLSGATCYYAPCYPGTGFD